MAYILERGSINSSDKKRVEKIADDKIAITLFRINKAKGSKPLTIKQCCAIANGITEDGILFCERFIYKVNEPNVSKVKVHVNNVPLYARNEKYIVARECDGLWFWGAWNDLDQAQTIAKEIGGKVLEVAEVL